MSRKPPVDVDEDSIRDAMMDVPRGGHFVESAPGKSIPMPQTEQSELVETDPEPEQALPAAQTAPKESEPARRSSYRKKKPQEEEQPYCDRFLVNDGVRSRVTTAIDRDIHKKMKKLLVLVAPEVTIVSYISNVLAHHLELFQHEIDELYRRETEKPL